MEILESKSKTILELKNIKSQNFKFINRVQKQTRDDRRDNALEKYQQKLPVMKKFFLKIQINRASDFYTASSMPIYM